METLVKVCGLTNAEDAAFAAAEGADLLGFVVHPPSPRHCANLARASSEVLDRAVLVTVNDDAEAIIRVAKAAGLHHIQPHVSRDHRRLVIQRLKSEGYFILLPWSDEPDQEALSVDLFLWEASPKETGVAGGSGQSHAMAHPPPGPFLLAGGLDDGNLQDRTNLMPTSTRAFCRGFDAASRLERAPGFKDLEKVSAFIRTAKSMSSEAFHARD